MSRQFATLLVLGLMSAAWATPAVAAQVISVGDGDTLTVMDAGRRVTVRLACIDAPETAQRPWGMEARTALQALTPVGSTISLRGSTKDRYGRTVAEVIRGGSIVNLALIGDGRAFVYRQYLSGCKRNAYLGAEGQAEKARRGVWSVPGGVTRPWDRRRGGSSSFARRSEESSSTRLGSDRHRCKEIGSWDRAQELLRQGHRYLDGDGDGEACESLK
ncbi:MAG: thermonuclease family protein [Cyanobium sp. D14.bin.5]|nr:thermonuclease family protein [Cyanobium sp. D14.bin.5]